LARITLLIAALQSGAEHRAGRLMVDDRRNIQRTRVLRSAKIMVPRNSSVIHCTVQNITGGGACLKLANTSGVPETFDLTFEHGRTRRSCRVVWRTADQLGVAFNGAEADAKAEPKLESYAKAKI
jgi:hypothetical protein